MFTDGISLVARKADQQHLHLRKRLLEFLADCYDALSNPVSGIVDEIVVSNPDHHAPGTGRDFAVACPPERVLCPVPAHAEIHCPHCSAEVLPPYACVPRQATYQLV